MQLSARNQLAGRVKEVKIGKIMAKLGVDMSGGHEVTPPSRAVQSSG